MCIKELLELLANFAAIVGAIVSVVVYEKTVKRERRILTIEVFSKFRDKFPLESYKMSQEEKRKYLREIEYICVGVNEGVFDFNIIQKMSGKLLLSQYNNTMKEFIEERRKEKLSDSSWSEYEEVIKRLKKHYEKN